MEDGLSIEGRPHAKSFTSWSLHGDGGGMAM